MRWSKLLETRSIAESSKNIKSPVLLISKTTLSHLHEILRSACGSIFFDHSSLCHGACHCECHCMPHGVLNEHLCSSNDCHGKTGRSVMCLDTRTLIQICNCLAYLYRYRQRARIFWSSWIGALFYDWRCSGNREVSIPRPKRQGKYLLGKDMSCTPGQLHVHMHHTPLQNCCIASISGLAHSEPCSRSATLYAYLVAE